MELIYIIAIIIACVIFISFMANRNESFTNKKEKVNTIHNWWKTQKSPAYATYQKDIPGSDVVEYKRVKDIVLGGKEITAESIEKIVS